MDTRTFQTSVIKWPSTKIPSTSVHHSCTRNRSGFTWAACVRLSQTEGQDTNNAAPLLFERTGFARDSFTSYCPDSIPSLRPAQRVGGDGGGAFSRVFFHTYTVTHHESSKNSKSPLSSPMIHTAAAYPKAALICSALTGTAVD